MQKDLLIDEEPKYNHLISQFKWWEKKRPIYNLIVGLAGVLPMIMYGFNFINMPTIIGILIYAFCANVFYSMGFLIELFFKYYFKSPIDFTSKRLGFFIVGTLLSVILTFGLSALISIIG